MSLPLNHVCRLVPTTPSQQNDLAIMEPADPIQEAIQLQGLRLGQQAGEICPPSGNGSSTFQHAAITGITHPTDGSFSHPPSSSRTYLTTQFRAPSSSTGKIRGRSQELQIFFVNLFSNFQTTTLIIPNLTLQSGVRHHPTFRKSASEGNGCLGGQRSRMPNLLPVFPSYERGI